MVEATGGTRSSVARPCWRCWKSAARRTLVEAGKEGWQGSTVKVAQGQPASWQLLRLAVYLAIRAAPAGEARLVGSLQASLRPQHSQVRRSWPVLHQPRAAHAGAPKLSGLPNQVLGRKVCSRCSRAAGSRR